MLNARYLYLARITHQVSRIILPNRHPHANMRPSFRCAVDYKCAAQARCSLAHRPQTKMARKRARRVKADAIVADIEREHRRLRRWRAQPQHDSAGARVLDDIVQ